ncbi:hypothetical protein NQ317_014752 [Molorchus minor]|uniref:Malonyl-CoA:ACP transacylase (MAT) domain-containing protein n=1 Tax=Molorchus minor TaxID=1323400 RepID=A0ABQ9J1M6_9CUCU|nr:hypothetical protein NQ317_014752 [Molorchus minor]
MISKLGYRFLKDSIWNKYVPDTIKCEICGNIRNFSLSRKKHDKTGEANQESPLKKMLDDSSSFEDIKTQNPQQQWATLPYPAATKIPKTRLSLGEITALTFAGALEFERALKLVKIRAEAMQLASEAYKGGMMTVIYGPDSKLNFACLKAKEWAKDKGDEVISGSESALDFLEKNYREFNLRKVKRLPVSGAFHSSLMSPAVEPFKKALNKSEISDPVIKVYSNVDGKIYRNAEHIRKQLPKQIVSPVKWEQLLHVVYERDPGEYFPRTFECGPGKSLKTILKQVNAKAWDECYNAEA